MRVIQMVVTGTVQVVLMAAVMLGVLTWRVSAAEPPAAPYVVQVDGLACPF